MSKEIMNTGASPFEQIKRVNDYGSDYWSARELMKIIDYSEYRHFKPIISKAMKACQNSGENVDDHFEQVLDMVEIGSNTKREVENYRLSRYACYLIVQNADPNKETVAIGQTYFAIQTRKQEINEEEQENQKRLFLRNEMKTHNTKLADAARNAGVIESKDYAIFQNYGYMGLYGGLTAKNIHDKKDLKKSQSILDHMGSTELAANLFRATQTEEKLRRENIKGRQNANKTHYKVGEKVRQTIKDLGGTMPENLPSVGSIKEIEKKQKNIAGTNIRLEINEEENILIQTENQVSTTRESLIEREQKQEDYIAIKQDLWKSAIQNLKKEGKMVLYANLLQSRAKVYNNKLIIVFNSVQEFSKILINKPENRQYLKNFFTKNLNQQIEQFEVIEEKES